MYIFKIGIIIILLLILITVKKCREGVVFEADYLHPYYKKYGITIDAKNQTLSKNGKTVSYANQFNPVSSIKIATDKPLSKDLFIKHGIPTSKHYRWDKYKSFNKNFTIMTRKLKFPVVIKPSDSYAGDGVHTNVRTYSIARYIIKQLLKYHNSIIIEEYIKGNTFRILTFNNKIIYAYKVTKPKIVGDGHSNAHQLINKFVNELNTKMTDNQINLDYLHEQNYGMNSIIPKNKSIIICDVANSTYGAEREIIPISDIHPDNIKLFQKLNFISGLNLNGIDYISESGLDTPHYISNGNILENNAIPGISFIPNIKNATDKFVKTIDFN
jgi:cyanophycin synthetase